MKRKAINRQHIILDYCVLCNTMWQRDTKKHINFCPVHHIDLLPQKPKEYFESRTRKMKKPEDMSEAYFRKKVIDPWLKKNARYWFATTGLICRNGIPDYCIQIGNITVYVEAKKVGEKLTPYEANEFVRLAKAKIPVFRVDPLNWANTAKRILELAYPGISSTDMSRIEPNGIYAIYNGTGEC